MNNELDRYFLKRTLYFLIPILVVISIIYLTGTSANRILVRNSIDAQETIMPGETLAINLTIQEGDILSYSYEAVSSIIFSIELEDIMIYNTSAIVANDTYDAPFTGGLQCVFHNPSLSSVNLEFAVKVTTSTSIFTPLTLSEGISFIAILIISLLIFFNLDERLQKWLLLILFFIFFLGPIVYGVYNPTTDIDMVTYRSSIWLIWTMVLVFWYAYELGRRHRYWK
jgi:hypothetical protein